MTTLDTIRKEFFNEIIDSIEVDGYTNAGYEYLKEAIKYFITTEEYEKCATIKNYLNEL